MTLIEFEAWVSDNYAELRAIAKRVGRHSARCVDSLHVMVETMLLHPDKIEKVKGDMFPWFNRALHLLHIEGLREDQRHARLDQIIATDWLVLGEDVFVDMKATNANKRRARSEATRKRVTVDGKRQWVDRPTQPDSIGVPISSLMSGQVGDTRWVYQQRRDARLYDGQAARSMGEYIRGASARSLRGTGRSLVHWGTEVSMDPREMDRWRAEVQAYKEAESWAWVSSSTGTQFHGKKWTGQDSPGIFDSCGGCSEHSISGRHDKACALRRAA